MGVPKFFRYISERYPCLSEVVKEYQIPEFDNLYLDMNGIIHMCSHPDDNNPHFRITEEKIFQDIFHYIEVLFRMIRPQKLFFMAVDGVAPRAKMNQQRGRRFRSAKDADKQELEAKKKGEKLPDVARFDSNCITPGTVFMARLHEQLKYFVVDKISNDPMWQQCKVILSGHETPGEGEHKIMDYIRYMRAQPGYDPNTRHCLYGLDADLIMLGLCTHEPHFSLLREEVKFGRKSTKRISVPEEITFFLLHLSLMREYLELEFAPLKDKLQGFEYDFEKIIDDWVLMGFLVGNDFIPHLPNLHIANGALPILYKAYMDILPTLDGYINEAGTLNLSRFQKFMEKLGNIDLENFEEIKNDLCYMELKTGKYKSHVKTNLKEWDADNDGTNLLLEPLEPERVMDSGLAALIKETHDMCTDSSEEMEDQTDEDDAFEIYKKDYYRNKLEYTQVTPEVMRDQAEGYVRAIQWNLNYYYNGCCSWSWYYPHHYAPYISDIKAFSNLKIEFDMGTPFLPYEQLLAVLPAASKNLLPTCYHHLMVEENSVIKKYYPEDFQTDLNGKKQEWEAVVLVPFIDENLLLEAMKSCNEKLTLEEKKRNSHGPMLVYTYTSKNLGPYSAPEYFNTIAENHADISTLLFNDVLVPKEKLVKGAYPGVQMNVYYPGFPTMKHLKYKAELKKAKIKVFESPSRNENMIINIIPDEKFTGEMIPVDLLGTSIFVSWPHLVEAKVVAISNSKKKFISMGGPGQYNVEERTGNLIAQFRQEIEGMTDYYQRRWGIECGDTKVLVHVQVMIGRRYVFSPNGRLTLEKQFTSHLANYPLQTVVYNICTYDSSNSIFRDADSVFPKGCSCFILTNPYYGSQGFVQDSKESLKQGRIKVCVSVLNEPDFTALRDLHAKVIRSYKTLHHAASQLSMTNFLFSRVTGSIFITARNSEGGLKNVNVGLDLKFNKKNKETPGYTKKIGTTWHYTDKAVEMVRLYTEKYPEIFNYLCQDDKFEDIMADKIFPNDSDEKLKELQNWLKTLPCYSVERQTCGSCSLEPEVIEELERIIDNNSSTANIKKVNMQVKPSFLYRPEIQNGTLMPDPKMNAKVLDRVVNVRNGFTVPYGLKGTIIAIQESTTGSDRDVMYDVVFDKPFKDGMSLNCSENRGYRLPKTAFINISYGQRLMVEKTGKPGEVIANAEASNRNRSFNRFKGPNNNINSFQPYQQNEQQQFGLPSQQWHSSQQNPQHRLPHFQQDQEPFQNQQSAFAQFSSIPGQRLPHPNQSNSMQPPQAHYNQRLERQAKKHAPIRQQQANTQNIPASPKVGGFNVQANNNLFMPNFGGVIPQEEKKIQVLQKTDVENVVTKDDNKNAATQASKSTHKVDTDFLKNILKIGTDNKENRRKVENTNFPPSSSQTLYLQEQSSVSFDMLAQAAKAPASVRLLTYYQSNGLGLPRYQYFGCGNMTQSQITLASGEVIIGKPAKTREEASENVAADVLEIFMKKAKAEGRIAQATGEFPVPPKTWVQPENDKIMNQDGKDNTLASKSKKTFVPLQVIKNQISKSNTNSNKHADNSTSNGNTTERREDTGLAGMSNKNQMESNTSVQPQSKPKKERKTRIAANFLTNKK